MPVTEVKAYAVNDVTDLVLTPDTGYYTVTYGEDSAPFEFCFYDSKDRVSYVLGADGEWAASDFNEAGKFVCGYSVSGISNGVPSEVEANLRQMATV